jgi:Short C-terminal domain
VSGRRVWKVALTTSIVLMVGSGIGFIATLFLGAFVLDKYNAYGELPIPGTAKLHLPAGQVTVSFHTVTVGSSSGGGGLPVPHLVLDIDPPAGVADPKVTESVGGSTSVNNDVHRRVWVVEITTEGDYIITTSGEVNGFISPQMAFGHDSASKGAWLGVIAGAFFIGLVGTVTASVRLSRTKRPEPPAWQVSAPPPPPPPHDQSPIEMPSDEGVKIQQLKTLAALRDSGALTEKEFQVEKRRVLDGG